LAWDTGAVTTGCVTVPLVLALGIGILTFVRAKGAVTATATGKAAGKAAAADLSGDTAMDLLGCAPPPASLDGFGIVTLASLFPIAFVLILGLLMNATMSADDIHRVQRDQFGICPPPRTAAQNTTADEAILTQRLLWAHQHAHHLRGQRRVLQGGSLECLAPEGTADAGAWGDAESGFWALVSESPYAELYLTVRAITPLLALLLLIFRFALREALPRVSFGPVSCPCLNASPLWGVGAAFVGLFTFNVGLTFGLSALGNDVGQRIPALFASLDAVEGSPFHSPSVGIALAAAFGLLLGLGATLAEPALNQLGKSTEEQTDGKFGQHFVVLVVACGVSVGVMTGVLKLVTSLSLFAILYVGYALAISLTFLSTNDFVCVGWDSAGVTTGPITVPLVLALGLGIGKALHAVDAFGLLSVASVTPILSVLLAGLARQRRRRPATLKCIV